MERLLIKILQVISRIGVWVFTVLNRLYPKAKGDPNKILLYCDMGLGDLVMFLPTVQSLLNNGYELTFRCMRPSCVEVLKGMYPQCNFIDNTIRFKVGQIPYPLALYLNNRKGRHGLAIVPMYCCGYSSLELFFLRIPRTVGHDWRKKWSGFYTDTVKFHENEYQVDSYLNLLKPLTDDVVREMFFKTEKFEIPDDYVLVQPFSMSDPRKNFMDFGKIAEENANVVLVGSKKEIDVALRKPWGKKCKHYTTNVFQAAYLIKNAKHFYSLETGLSHIGAALKTPTTIYTSDDERTHHPRTVHHGLRYVTYVKV